MPESDKGLGLGEQLDSTGAVKEAAPGVIERSAKPMRFVSLHHHSTFSFLDGFGLPEDHIRRAAELNMSALALTEHGNVSSHVRLSKAAKEYGIRPIYGCELYTGATDETNRTQRKNHLTVLAATRKGYNNLLQLVSRAWAEGFYYEPTVDGAMLAEHREGLIILSGCTGSLLATSLIGGKNVDPSEASYERAREVARRFKRTFGDAYYLEVQAFPELSASRQINVAYERLSEELGIPLVATGDVHYPYPEDNEMQRILHHVRGGGKQSLEQQSAEFEYDIRLTHPQSDNDVYKALRETGLSKSAAKGAVLASEEIASRIDVDLPEMPPLRFPLPGGYDNSTDLYRDWIREGWRYRGVSDLPKAKRREYRDRLYHETAVIEEKEYADYMLIMADIVRFAKDRGIPVGPARGSAAASLVCYLLRITEVDPIRYPHLVFERFIDKTRVDPPDIDLDFDDDRREELREYAVAKYGAECVGNIGTFTAYKSKNALDDIARAHDIPPWEVDPIKEVLIERSSGDLRASATIEDSIEMFDQAKAVVEKHPQLWKATNLEGNYRGMGVHAAGLIVSPRPLTEVCAVYSRIVAGHQTEVISLDKYDAEAVGMIKLDLLGLKTMGAIRVALETLGLTLDDLYALEMNDEDVINGFRENDVVGVFQFDGRAMRIVNGDLRPDSFSEICDVNALARPGPLHSGATEEYVEVKHGRKDPTHIHPMLDRITDFTNYQIVYQEQILRICMEIGQFDWTHAAYIRKIISRKIGEQEFNRQGTRFLEGAKANGLTEEQAQSIWASCITAGSYAFNAAHCVSYGMLAYWTMWLKRKHPEAFYQAMLVKLGPQKDRQLTLLRDARKHNIEIRPPDPKLSGRTWSIESGALRSGLEQVEGIGGKIADKMIEYRDEYGVGAWNDYTAVRGVGPKTAERIAAFVSQDDPFGIEVLHTKIEQVKKDISNGELTDPENDDALLPEPTHTALEIPSSRGQDVEAVWIGVITHRNLRDLFEVNSRRGTPLTQDEVKEPDKREWVILTGQDADEILSLNIDRWRYPSFRDLVWSIDVNKDLVLVRGVKKGWKSHRSLYVSNMWVISTDDD